MMDMPKDSERLRNLSNTERLELAYQESLRTSDLIVKDEGARRLRLQILLLEDENDDLHEQLAIDDDRIDGLELEREELQRQVDDAEAESRRQDTELRLHARELSNMKAELNSMNGVSVDSTKLLTEKLSLARELATLKPELEHLRNQATYQQTVLAEKLALQRQVSTLEVELETEKRAIKRASQKDKDEEREAELQRELDGVRKELAREKREREKSQHTAEKGSNEWETRNTLLENKVEQLKAKLRETKEQLKESREDLAQAREQLLVTRATVSTEAPVKNSRKRGAQQISTDATIGTPDGVAVRGRRPTVSRGKPESLHLGEKSMFSITPYLNRTISVAPETPREEVEVPEAEGKAVEVGGKKSISTLPSANDEVVEVKNEKSKFSASKLDLKQKVPTKNILNESKAGTTNAKAGLKKQRMLGTLEKVMEEETDDNVALVAKDTRLETKKIALKTQASVNDEAEPKKKKRKLLGAAKTLFDEEDGEATKRPAKVILGPARSLGKGGVAGVKSSFGAFGAFSPLKKDKRGTQASFLL